ncbi:hypothetical protein [uncultured Imperialibacter sp.]|uniref:hypothetical protein n=1 Tax=uncultured Imperialibacter sp. TaxID=1672639 RepID=UPI0030D93584|tara:strand:- start:734 stop:1357 length:624 start_codon:yes stop_codon:yes gene_type:complete
MKLSFIFLALLTCPLVKSQSFEGVITYQISYSSKLPNVTSEQFSSMMGTTQEYYIKHWKYKSVSNGSLSEWQLYVPSENRLYNKFNMSDTLLWNDGGVNADKVVSYEIKKSQAEVLGYNCDALILNTQSGKTIYYYNDKLKVDLNLYKNHRYGNWALIMEQTKSLALKMEIETPQFSMTSVAVQVKEMELPDSFFALPEAPAKKSPY